MNSETVLEKGAALLTPWAQETLTPEPNRLDVVIAAQDLQAAAKALVDAKWGYLTAIAGLDLGPEVGQIEALYPFCSGPHILTLRIRVPRSGGSIPSICPIISYASLYERELMEMLGVDIVGTPERARLFLPDDWPDGIYPLLKDFDPDSIRMKGKPGQIDAARAESKEHNGQGEQFIVPIGPQHPALKEPGHFLFTVDGEIVTAASVRLGYVHRGIEKACEDRTWIQALYLLERVCGICSHVHAYAYTLGVERLAGIEAPPRAEAIRELVAGLERIHSHLLWLGVAAHEAGFDTLFMYSWRDRETIMDLLELITGNRVNYSANVLGGVKFDIDSAKTDAIRKGLDFLEKRTHHYLDVVTTDAAFLQRTRGVGVTTKEEAERLGIVGPTARASGLTRDIRVEAPYGSYHRYPVHSIRETAGDLEAKFIVRIKELFVSYLTIPSILDNLPSGDISVRMPRKIPAGETYSRVEAPRGELIYFIRSTGGDKPDRIKVRTPSMCNFASVMHLVIGHQLADVPLILAGIDPCFSCNDRIAVIKRQGEPDQVLPFEALSRLRRPSP